MELSNLTQKARDNAIQLQVNGPVFISKECLSYLLESQNAETKKEDSLKNNEIMPLIKNGLNNLDSGDRIKHSIFRHAAEIVSEIDKSALFSLTIFYMLSLRPTALNSLEGLMRLSQVMEKLSEENLSENALWLEHLDLLKVVRILPWQRPCKLSQYYPSNVPGYTSVGINVNSPQYKRAKKILQDVQLPDFFLLRNEFLPGYVRLSIPDFSILKRYVFEGKPLTEKQQQALLSIIDLYDTDPAQQKTVNEHFMTAFDLLPALKKIHIWCDSIPYSFDITAVGLLLANLNARRFEPTIPAYLEE